MDVVDRSALRGVQTRGLAHGSSASERRRDSPSDGSYPQGVSHLVLRWVGRGP